MKKKQLLLEFFCILLAGLTSCSKTADLPINGNNPASTIPEEINTPRL